MPSDFLTLMLDGRVPMKFRLIPAGEFRMGSRGSDSSEEPIHRVRITKPFYIGVYPVTQLQWQTIVETVPPVNDPFDGAEQDSLTADPSRYKRDNSPVETVSWDASRAWCQRLFRSSAVRDCVDDAEQSVEIVKVDLPTEAEWEYACRLVQTTPSPVCSDTEYNTGDGEAALSAAGRYDKNSSWETHDVGGRAPNGIGLYDMHGNVWEWCLDAYAADAYKLRIDGISDLMVRASPVGKSEKDAIRVFRAGSWGSSAGDCRATYRGRCLRIYRDGNLGFRVCLFFGPVPSQQTQQGVKPPRSRRTQAEKSRRRI
jgi:formylglycine-generating enzyme required for sulfatase activity